MTAATVLLAPARIDPALASYLMSFLDVMAAEMDSAEYESASCECKRLLGTMDRESGRRLAVIVGTIGWQIRTIH